MSGPCRRPSPWKDLWERTSWPVRGMSKVCRVGSRQGGIWVPFRRVGRPSPHIPASRLGTTEKQGRNPHPARWAVLASERGYQLATRNWQQSWQGQGQGPAMCFVCSGPQGTGACNIPRMSGGLGAGLGLHLPRMPDSSHHPGGEQPHPSPHPLHLQPDPPQPAPP